MWQERSSWPGRRRGWLLLCCRYVTCRLSLAGAAEVNNSRYTVTDHRCAAYRVGFRIPIWCLSHDQHRPPSCISHSEAENDENETLWKMSSRNSVQKCVLQQCVKKQTKADANLLPTRLLMSYPLKRYTNTQARSSSTMDQAIIKKVRVRKARNNTAENTQNAQPYSTAVRPRTERSKDSPFLLPLWAA